MLGVVRLGGGSDIWGMGKACTSLEGLGGEGRAPYMSGASWAEGLSFEVLPVLQGIHLHPSPCLSNWAVQMALAPRPQRP